MTYDGGSTCITVHNVRAAVLKNIMRKVEIYDTTLRDGSQAEDIAFSVEDKLRITGKLDELGVRYIEGGWPGSNPKDADYFKKSKKLKLKNSVVAAFRQHTQAKTQS